MGTAERVQVQSTVFATPVSSQAVSSQAVSSQAVIASLRQHGIGFTADNYAVWHCYMTGSNVALRRAIDVVLSNGMAIEERALRVLYARYFCQAREAVALRDVAQRSLRTLAELAELPDPPAARECMQRLSRDMQEIVHQSDRMTDQLTQSEVRIAQLEQFLDSARQEASTDALTGIANRRAFDAALRTRAGDSMNAGSDLAFVLVDIDHFKLVNDRWGHGVGDDVLRMIASTLVRHVRGSDVVARYGGEEFAVILPDTGRPGALTAAEHLRAAVERQGLSVPGAAQDVWATISAGVACYEHGETLAAWLGRADEALYAAKRAGRNRVAFGDHGGRRAEDPPVPLSRAG